MSIIESFYHQLNETIDERGIIDVTINDYNKMLFNYVDNNFKMIGLFHDGFQIVAVKKKGFFGRKWSIEIKEYDTKVILDPDTRAVIEALRFNSVEDDIVFIFRYFQMMNKRMSYNFMFLADRNKEIIYKRINEILRSDEDYMAEMTKKAEVNTESEKNIVQ